MEQLNIGDIVKYYWSASRSTKTTPSGWISANAVCCHSMGYTIDTRKRGGLLVKHDGSFAYSCFNCSFKASWEPGKKISNRCKRLFEWLGIPDDDIRKMSLYALSLPSNTEFKVDQITIPVFDKIKPPPGARVIDHNTPYQIMEYIVKRNLDPYISELYYTNVSGYTNRLFFPIIYDRKLIGWTGRSVLDKTPKYLSKQPVGCVYGLNKQSPYGRFVIVTEGIMDAIHVHGVALLGSQINQIQQQLLENLKRTIIVVPDRDLNGKKMFDTAIELGLNVSLPDWDIDIKDVSDAVDRYGRLVTFGSILTGVCSNTLKAKLIGKRWFNI